MWKPNVWMRGWAVVLNFPSFVSVYIGKSEYLQAHLPGESQGQGSLVGCCLGLHRVGFDWSNLAAVAAAAVCIKQSRTDIVGMLVCSLDLRSSKNALYSLKSEFLGGLQDLSEWWHMGQWLKWLVCLFLYWQCYWRAYAVGDVEKMALVKLAKWVKEWNVSYISVGFSGRWILHVLEPLIHCLHEWGDVQFSCSVVSCLCDPMDCSTLGLPVHHHLLEFPQTHVHRVGSAIQPSHPLSSPSPPTFNLSQHQGLFKCVSSSHQVAKVLEFQLQHQFFQWIFRTDFL